MSEKGKPIKEAKGKLGVLLPGMGAVGTTFIAGTELIRTNQAKPIGSLTQMGTIRLGKRTDNRVPLIKDFVPLAELDDLVFAGWDIFPGMHWRLYHALRNNQLRRYSASQHFMNNSDLNRLESISSRYAVARPATLRAPIAF